MRRGHTGGLVAALVVAAPVLIGIGYSLLAALEPGAPAGSAAPSLERLTRVLSDGATWRALAWSVWVAAAATAISAAAAILLAVVFRRAHPLDRLARLVAVSPLPIPHVVAGVLGVLILSQSGLLARAAFALGWISDPADMPPLVYDRAGIGMILSLAWKETPFLALIAFSIMAGRARDLEEAARTLGAGAAQVFRRVTLPVLWRGMLPPIVAVFAFAAGSYEAAVLLAPSDPLALPLLTMERYTDASLETRGDAFVLVLVGMAVAVLAVAGHEWLREEL